MIAIGMALLCFGVPIVLIVIALVWLWLGDQLFGSIFSGG